MALQMEGKTRCQGKLVGAPGAPVLRPWDQTGNYSIPRAPETRLRSRRELRNPVQYDISVD